MKKEEILHAGLLELYALGELDEIEQKIVFLGLKKYPELKHELTNIEDSLRILALSAAIEPSLRIMTTIN